MNIQKQLLLLLAAGVLFCQQTQAGMKPLGMLSKLPGKGNWTVIDTRGKDICSKETLTGAICFSSEELVDKTGRLPSFKKISWLLGTYGINGDEPVVITGNIPKEKNFIAGILYLLGQKQVMILALPLDRVLKDQKTGPGRNRAASRLAIYAAQPRQQEILLNSELKALLTAGKSLLILDARSEDEYWGHVAKTVRGGHVPGAELWDIGLSVSLARAVTASQTVIYAHTPASSMDAFVRIKLVQPDSPIAVLIEGWRSWATEPGMPVDAQTPENYYNITTSSRSNT